MYGGFRVNPLTPKPAVTDHATSILVGRVSAGYCSESGRRQLGEWSLRDPLRVEIRDERPSTTRSEEKWGNGVDESISPIH
ncbi:hypothetical protein AVEN_17595-1 [Araneus ventricosus]|uniref:Uncharacterized protein n=1 Tax=Araneus ventricosus TaxID=182803 RepID=A0A4Y2HWN4_ARAVE|nr:hypothetical protein AVEN_17595-1 [Araneus ventricosus]